MAGCKGEESARGRNEMSAPSTRAYTTRANPSSGTPRKPGGPPSVGPAPEQDLPTTRTEPDPCSC
eukprot:3452573-Alexandrium_andersonii.AAC.1